MKVFYNEILFNYLFRILLNREINYIVDWFIFVMTVCELTGTNVGFFGEFVGIIVYIRLIFK